MLMESTAKAELTSSKGRVWEKDEEEDEVGEKKMEVMSWREEEVFEEREERKLGDFVIDFLDSGREMNESMAPAPHKTDEHINTDLHPPYWE